MKITTKELKGIFLACADIMVENMSKLSELDSLSGDGDLGLAMKDGFTAVAVAIKDSEETDIGQFTYCVGKTLLVGAPSTTGTLLASGIIKSAKEFQSCQEMGIDGLAQMMRTILEEIMSLGKAKQGEKTFIDGFAPAVEVLEAATDNEDIELVVSDAARAAKAGAEKTVGMLAVHGRAAVKGENSRGMIDPGAVVACLIFEAMSSYFKILK